MKEITIPEAGSKIEVIVRSVKERMEATYITVEWRGAIVVIISIGIGMAFFTILPGFVSSAVDALIDPSDPVNATAIANVTGTIINLVPFVVGALFIVYPLVFLAVELKKTTE